MKQLLTLAMSRAWIKQAQEHNLAVTIALRSQAICGPERSLMWRTFMDAIVGYTRYSQHPTAEKRVPAIHDGMWLVGVLPLPRFEASAITVDTCIGAIGLKCTPNDILNACNEFHDEYIDRFGRPIPESGFSNDAYARAKTD